MATRNVTPQESLDAIFAELSEIFSLGHYNFLPVVTKNITQHNGIDITGEFHFQDYSSGLVTPMCYVTVRRNESQPFPSNGFGFAFGKMDPNGPSSGIYNVYLVDNSHLLNEVMLYNEIILQNNGINNFLAAGRRELVTGTTYQFKLRINEYNAAKLWIVDDDVDLDTGLDDNIYVWRDADGTYVNAPTSGYIVSMGARSYEYEPQSQGNAFGLGVLETNEGNWFFDNIRIKSIIDHYPFAYFKMKLPTSLRGSSTNSALFEWDGYGTWNDATGSGIQLWFQQNDGDWEKIGEHTWIPGAPIDGRRIRKEIDDISDYNIGNNLNVYVTTLESHTKPILYTDYVHLSTLMPSGVHQGNLLDVYIHDPSKISRATIDITTNELWDISAIGPIVGIRSVSEGGILLIEGDPDIGYIINTLNESLAFSNQDQIRIDTETSITVTVEYLYYEDGLSAQSYTNSDSFRYPGLDILVKAMPPVIISIDNLEYTGGPDSSVMREKVVEYINDLTNEFDVSKLVIYMQSLGASSFNLDTIEINAEAYDVYRNITYHGPVTTNYVITDTGGFVTEADEVLGIIKV